jgi:uncharacterized glyoxalase superfamily protein PhnB
VRSTTDALNYDKAAFGAVESDLLEDDEGDVIVARLSIDDADFWVQRDPDSRPDAVRGMSARMILTVDDRDSGDRQGACELTSADVEGVTRSARPLEDAFMPGVRAKFCRRPSRARARRAHDPAPASRPDGSRLSSTTGRHVRWTGRDRR